MMVSRLGVNIDHVATVRQARRMQEPEPTDAATLAMLGGADGITVHLREDRRHIQDRDVILLKEVLTVPLNLEMAISEEIIDIACKVRPQQVTLVPEKREEITTEGGLDVAGDRERYKKVVKRLQDTGITVSMFIDPDRRQLDASKYVGADAIEIHTGTYANTFDTDKGYHALHEIVEISVMAKNMRLHVHAGHGLNYRNVLHVARIAGIEELNIGHSIVSRAVLVGMERAVREMKQRMQGAAGGAGVH